MWLREKYGLYGDGLVFANSVVAGLITVAVASLGGQVSKSFGSGWRSLLVGPS